MTDEERQRAMDFIVEQQAKNSVEIEKVLESHRRAEPHEKTIEARRKLDRDMNRLERVLKRMVESNPRARRRKHPQDKRWREFEKRSREHFAKIATFAAVSDQKLKALIDHIRNDRAKRES